MNKLKPTVHLHQLRVLITRPSPAGDVLCKLIDEHGGQAIHFPTIAFTLPADMYHFEQTIKHLDQQDWMIFISPQAVYATRLAIQKCWPEFPWQVKVAAVGAGTAAALQKMKLPVHAFPTENWGSCGILDLPEFQQVTGKNILLVRGEGGRPELAETLVKRGAHLSHLIAYQRSLPHGNFVEGLALIKANVIDAVVCASGESLENLKKLCQSEWLFLQFIPVVVVSQRMVDLARALGFHKILLAKNASHDAIMDALALVY